MLSPLRPPTPPTPRVDNRCAESSFWLHGFVGEAFQYNRLVAWVCGRSIPIQSVGCMGLWAKHSNTIGWLHGFVGEAFQYNNFL
ncbi:MAG: hypothetical protein F6J93_12660 [Oscillatoria sp. SIO1A7]|nr:hypothetical protein [Oscillatoria sp. SIO1A7]